MEEQIRRLKLWDEGKKKGPYFFRLFLTSRCNLKCKFCVYGSKKSEQFQEELTLKEWIRIIKEVSGLGCKRVDILGGEPFIRKYETIKIMSMLKEHNFSASVTTNGTLLDSNMIHEIVKMDWDVIQISIDSPNKKIHDYYRGEKGTFNKAIKSLKLFNYWKNKLKKKKPSVVVASVLTNWNFLDLEEMVKLTYKYKANCFDATPLFQDFPEVGKFQLNEENNPKLLKSIKYALKYVKEKKLFSNLQGLYENFDVINEKDKFEKIKQKRISEKKIEFPICFEPWLTLKIDSGGWVTCCSSQSEKKFNIKNKDVRDLWYGKYFNKIRIRMLRKQPINACKHCCYNVYSTNMKLYENIKRREPNLLKIH